MTPSWTWAFLLSAAVWGAGMAVGYAVVQASSELPSELPAALAAVAETPHDMGVAPEAAPEIGAGLAAFIFRRNLSVYLWLLAGLLSAGSVTFVILLVNGVMLGQTIALAGSAGLSALGLANLLVPHGVLEVGTFCIAGAVGFQGLRLVQAWGSIGWPTVKALRLGLVVAFGVGALAVAAGLETFVTGALADSVN